MDSNPVSRMPHKHANGWMTVVSLGLLALGLLACLYVLVGLPAEAQETGAVVSNAPGGVDQVYRPRATAVQTPAQITAQTPAPTLAQTSAQTLAQAPAQATTQTLAQTVATTVPTAATDPSAVVKSAPPATTLYQPSLPIRRRQVPIYILQAPEQPANQVTLPRAAELSAELTSQLNTVREQLGQARDLLRQAEASQHRTRVASALFLAVFAVIAALIVIQVYIQVRGWDRETLRASEEMDELNKQVEGLRVAGSEFRTALPALLQEIGEQPLSYQEEGTPFAPRTLAMIADIDHLAYVGQGRFAFRDLSSDAEAAVYLNGLLLSAVAHLSRKDPWTAFARLDLFFVRLSQFPDAVERLRIAQAYSYRALAAYQVLEIQNKEPSWLRKGERGQLEALSKQAFGDVAHAATVEPEWKHATFVEALLCSRFYLADEAADGNGRGELVIRGMRRAVTLYKGLMDEHAYRGPARRHLIRSLKQIAEQTGDKSDFSDFGYALNAFPTDEELADEALAGRQPNSQDRFLWQWLLGDEELFARVERLNLAEYRAFWIRMLDNKVHLRNWRADLAELQLANPAMKDWSIQLLQAEPPLSLSSAVNRRLERYDSSASGT